MAQRNIEISDILWDQIKLAALTRGQNPGTFVRDAAYTFARRFHEGDQTELEYAPFHPSGLVGTVRSGFMTVRTAKGNYHVKVDLETGFVAPEHRDIGQGD